MPIERVFSEQAQEGASGEQENQSQVTELTIGSLQVSLQELKAKVASANLRVEEDIEQRVSDRESFIGKAEENDKLLGTAREALDYFVSMQELDQLDTADQTKLEELRTLVLSLEQQRDEIQRKITAISSRPEIQDKLRDAADKENAERTIKSLVEQTQAELNPQIDQLARAIKDSVSRDLAMRRQIAEQEEAKDVASEEIQMLFDRANNMLRENSEFGFTLQQIWRDHSSSSAALQNSLTDTRQSLGMFKGKEKAAVDFILDQRKLFDQHSRATTSLSSSRQERELLKLKNEATGLAEQLKKIFGESWAVQDKISELGGSNTFIQSLNAQLLHRLDDHFSGTQNRVLFQTYEEIRQDAHANALVYSHPNRVFPKNQE